MNRFLKTARRGAAGLVAALLLSSCGGGDPVVAFRPTRLIVFGDELSAMTSDGHKYTVNAVDTTSGALLCTSNPTWFQRVASYYGLVLNQCNTAGVTDAPSRVLGVAGATVADLATQVDAQVAASAFAGTDLVLIMVGQNDVLAAYATYEAAGLTAQAKADALAGLRASGEAYAAQVSRIAAAGGKVIASTPVDVSFTPYARGLVATEPKARTDLGEMVAKFAEGLRYGLRNESGSQVALMLGNELTRLMGRSADEGFGSAYGLSDSKTAVCVSTVVVEQCTNLTLIDPDNDTNTVTSSSAYLWADDTRIGPAGHNYLGSLAINRSTANPF